jgi:hypothetical protein
MSNVKISGNYLLVVYENDDIEQLVFSKRFVIYENLVTVESRVHESSVAGDRQYRQEVDFVIHHPSYDIPNPYSDLKVWILQNDRWDNAISHLEPRFVKNRELEFDYTGENSFDGNNEFRNFDLKDLRYYSIQIDSISRTPEGWESWLHPDPNRGFKLYRTDPDINGKFLVKNDEGFDDHLEADYIMVHFNLPFDFALSDAGVYIYGALSNFSCPREFRMDYNYVKKAYEADLLLKQGYYNYLYAVLKEGDDFPDLAVVEGTHFETNNNYTIFVYNYEISGDYDRVVGRLFTDSYNR